MSEHPYLAGARELACDLRVAGLLLREGRDRVCKRLFGISEVDAGVVTAIALVTLAAASHEKAQTVVSAPGGPTAADVLIGAGVVREMAHWIAGELSDETPAVAALIVGAVVAHHLRPWVQDSTHAIRGVSRRTLAEFRGRYGNRTWRNQRSTHASDAWTASA